MSRCEAEDCPNWTGDGCLCAVMNGDLDEDAARRFLCSLDDISDETEESA
jgi:hypothetical protein